MNLIVWSEYREWAVSNAQLTKDTDLSARERLAYLTLGLLGELGEWQQAYIIHTDPSHVREELGDALWYLAMLEHELNIRLTWQHEDPSTIASYHHASLDKWHRMSLCLSVVAESVKRLMQPKRRPLPTADIERALNNFAALIDSCGERWIIEALAANKSKLIARYHL